MQARRQEEERDQVVSGGEREREREREGIIISHDALCHVAAT